ncbi:MAG: Phosphate metabolism transcription protein [Icmadophila ericetorum]|nr:Phosphate metabolism transcription protein [Icmadophila ericetorum]
MRFGQILRSSIYEPWQSHYIDYAKLKGLLREDKADKWTEDDEEKFVLELTEVELQKVNEFYLNTYESLLNRISECGEKLKKVAQLDNDQVKKDHFNEILRELEGINKEVNELKKYCQVNFTGFFKAAKKHDRKRGDTYRVRTVLEARLQPLRFKSDDFSSLVFRLSEIYSFIKQNQGEDIDKYQPLPGSEIDGDEYTAHKYVVHLKNLLQVKTLIIHHLPILVYNPQTSKVLDGSQSDPSITSLYFDNPKFSLYARKVGKVAPSTSLRLRWFGPLQDKPEIFLEKKIIDEHETSQDIRFSLKEKHILPFIKGDYHMEKGITKLRERHGEDSVEASQLEKNAREIQEFIQHHELQPMLRANYQRTAFQIPGDDRIRVSIDTNLAMIREDSLNVDKPTRSPNEWHRLDIDNRNLQYPFDDIGKDDLTKFPFAVLEIKIKNGISKKTIAWVEELENNYMLTQIPKFSKFSHGVALLFEDYVNSLPLWLSSLNPEVIRGDPQRAFEEEQAKKQRQRDDEFAVGSYTGSKGNPKFAGHIGSPAGRLELLDNTRSTRAESDVPSSRSFPPRANNLGTIDGAKNHENGDGEGRHNGKSTGLRSLLPTLSVSRYARARRTGHSVLPEGVYKPNYLIKESGPVEVEPKVWLANQRTFIKWCHVSILLASLSLGLFNAAGKHNEVARTLGIVYTAIAVFAGFWGWRVYIVRSDMIRHRSGKDFDSIAGPIIVCVGLLVALILNFVFKYHAIASRHVEQFSTCIHPSGILHQIPNSQGQYEF